MLAPFSFLAAAALIATRAPNTKGEQIVHEHDPQSGLDMARNDAAGWTPAADAEIGS